LTNLFKKAAVFTDIHFGKKGNSREYNIDCEKFVEWFIEEAHAWGADTCLFLGDWHDSRRFINVSTLNYSLSNLEKINKAFPKTYFILGNHDLYYREKREINSIEFGRNLENITIINEITEIGDCLFVPWLVGDEWKQVESTKAKYVFGHFELPKFKMNAMVEMPDKGELQEGSFTSADYVFTGHFHKRQNRGNVWYIGNAFPHNYSDAWDDERGMMFLEWDKKPEFKTWDEQPVYRTLKLSTVVENPPKYLNQFVSARITADVDLTYEEATFLKDTFLQQYNCRDISLVTAVREDEEMEFSEDVEFQSVDQIVIEGLNSLSDSGATAIDPDELIQIYHSLDIDSN